MNEMGLRILAKKSYFRPIRNEAGQGSTEYILIAALAVAIFLGLMSQFYKPFGRFSGNLMGNYLSCLLDVGELPALGGTAPNSVCKLEYQKGTPPVAGPPGSGPPPGSSQSNSNSTQNEQNSNSSSGASGETAGSGSGTLAQSRGFKVGQRGGADGENSSSNAEMTAPLPQSRYYRFGRTSGGSTATGQRTSVVGMAGLLAAEKKKIERRQDRVFKTALSSEGSDPSKNKKMLMKPIERKVTAEEPEMSWGFAQWLKYAVIILIVIALILFLGGQMLQISKSMEK